MTTNLKIAFILNGKEYATDFNVEVPMVGDFIIFKDGQTAKVVARVWERDLDGGFQRNVQVQCKPCKIAQR